ncbi:MAG: manganese efflux pump [Bacilli bacterium]|nr:manganese efflux pump [Bacilli bacterium]
MDWVEVLLTSVSMAMDATTVNAANGLEEARMKVSKMAFIAAFFGLMQFLMPCLGYFLGYSFKDMLKSFIPWIAFILLFLLALKAFIDWLKERKESNETIKEKTIGLGEIIVQGIATSIDALCIGFIYLNLNIIDALIVFGIIGVTTFAMSFFSALLAKRVAKPLLKWAGLLASIVFLGVGLKILLTGIL